MGYLELTFVFEFGRAVCENNKIVVQIWKLVSNIIDRDYKFVYYINFSVYSVYLLNLFN